MRTAAIALAVVMAGLLAACGMGKSKLPDNPGAPERIAQIKENALALAQKEMERFQALEEKYKNDVEEFKFLGHPFNPNIGVYTKTYRVWKDAEVADIILSDSLERPYKVPVEYSFEVWSTKYYPNHEPDAQENAEQETEFEKIREVDHQITYYANFDCEMTDDVGEWPGRVNYYPQKALMRRDIEWKAAPPRGAGAAQSPPRQTE